MSYDAARTCLSAVQGNAPPHLKPIEYDLAAALLNLADAIQEDFRSLRFEVSSLRQKVESLERASRK